MIQERVKHCGGCKRTYFQTKGAMYVKRHIEGRALNHCCHVKAINTTYAMCVCVCVRVCVVLAIQHEKHRRHVICGLSSFSLFLHIILRRRGFFQKNIEHRIVFWFPLQFMSEMFLIPRTFSKMYKMYKNVLHVKCSLFLSKCNEAWIFSTDFLKT